MSFDVEEGRDFDNQDEVVQSDQENNNDGINSAGKTYAKRVKTRMLSRNINVLGRCTSIRLDKEMWEALKSVASKEQCSVHDLCSLVDIRKRENTSLTAAIRVFVMLYFKAAATEEGHILAGHGSFEQMKRRAGITGDISTLQSKSITEDVSYIQQFERHESESGGFQGTEKRHSGYYA